MEENFLYFPVLVFRNTSVEVITADCRPSYIITKIPKEKINEENDERVYSTTELDAMKSVLTKINMIRDKLIDDINKYGDEESKSQNNFFIK